jgi:hypothetical protein
MSTWVDRQRQEAFNLYRRYIGVSLHFKAGSSYDYTLYNGGSRITLRSFLQKSPGEISKFVQLKNKLSGITPEEFLFAQARYDNLNINNLLDRKAFNLYEDWHSQYGAADTFLETVTEELQRYVGLIGIEDNTAIKDVVMQLLDTQDDHNIEMIAWILQTTPNIATDVRAGSEASVFRKMMLDRAIRVQRFYSYLCII